MIFSGSVVRGAVGGCAYGEVFRISEAVVLDFGPQLYPPRQYVCKAESDVHCNSRSACWRFLHPCCTASPEHPELCMHPEILRSASIPHLFPIQEIPRSGYFSFPMSRHSVPDRGPHHCIMSADFRFGRFRVGLAGSPRFSVGPLRVLVGCCAVCRRRCHLLHFSE